MGCKTRGEGSTLVIPQNGYLFFVVSLVGSPFLPQAREFDGVFKIINTSNMLVVCGAKCKHLTFCGLSAVPLCHRLLQINCLV
jgi:hypothetical protein